MNERKNCSKPGSSQTRARYARCASAAHPLQQLVGARGRGGADHLREGGQERRREGALEVAAGEAAQPVVERDRLALLGQPQPSRWMPGRLREDRRVGRSASAAGAAAAAVEDRQLDPALGRDAREPLLRPVDLPVRGQIAAVLARVRVADHHLRAALARRAGRRRAATRRSPGPPAATRSSRTAARPGAARGAAARRLRRLRATRCRRRQPVRPPRGRSARGRASLRRAPRRCGAGRARARAPARRARRAGSRRSRAGDAGPRAVRRRGGRSRRRGGSGRRGRGRRRTRRPSRSRRSPAATTRTTACAGTAPCRSARRCGRPTPRAPARPARSTP